MLIKQFFISVLFLCSIMVGNAQSGFNKHISWWPAYYLKYAISDRWTLTTDIQARNFSDELLVGSVAVRSGFNYRINSQWNVALGGAWFHQQQLNAAKQKLVTDELRLWEEVRHEVNLNKWKLINQFRTEQRHWIKQDGMGFRFRYRLAGEYLFNEKWKAMMGNELMWQSRNTRKDWEQNRLWLGGEFSFNSKNQLQLLVMNWWQFSANIYQPVVRINFLQSIN